MKHFIGDFCPAKACNFRRRKIPPAFTEIIPRHQGNHAPLRRKISPAFLRHRILLIKPVKIRILLRKTPQLLL